MMGDDSIVEGISHLLELRKRNGKEFMQVLKAVAFRDTGVIDVNKDGIRITVDDQHCEQAVAYLPNDSFSVVIHREAVVNVRIPLDPLISTLSILDHHDSNLRITYNGYGEPLQVFLEHDEVVVDTQINTLTNEQRLEFDFLKEDLKARIIMKANVLKDAFREFDSSSPAVLFIVNNENFSVQTKGDMGTVTTTFPRTSDSIDTIECARMTHTSYRLTLLKKMEKALAISSKISLRIDRNGLLMVQFMVEKCLDNNQIFIEYLCVSDSEQPYPDEEDTAE